MPPSGFLQQAGDGGPALVIVERDALRVGDGDDLLEDGGHQALGAVEGHQLMRHEMQQAGDRQRAGVQGQLLPNLVQDLVG